MENLGVTETEINDILQVVAIVLHLGNISFKKKDDDTAVSENTKGFVLFFFQNKNIFLFYFILFYFILFYFILFYFPFK